MINEKSEMGFSEYLNAHYLMGFGDKEVQKFYTQQATALEKALDIENNHCIKNLINSYDDERKWIDSNKFEDGIFISYLFSRRMEILNFLNNQEGLVAFPNKGVDKKKLDLFFKNLRDSRESLFSEIEFCDKYIWGKLINKDCIKISLNNLRKEYNYPSIKESDLLAKYF